ncbi:hypothetical protein G7Y89_g76 [Cudoniella acicularis]|uniref:Heterokaryon incompatibility domain-containing protein n=1 Tax=Cudoniella acicularis TaxID=354080 RepID=A0A8H4W8M9_9HELO|nr:hypothetical protein G7Y89_g76 [Cudoniella acicularis]
MSPYRPFNSSSAQLNLNFEVHQPQYQYASLKPKEGQTRILTLLPSSQHGASIYCVLKITSIDPVSTPFEALSYTWGEEGDVCPDPIFLNGYSVKIRRNIEVFLRILRHATLPRELWADAICINQASYEEKSVHLDMMAFIYSRARRVVIWLGLPTDTSALAVSVLPTISPEADFLRISNVQSHAIDLLFSREWFTRVWVVQGFMLGQDAISYC